MASTGALLGPATLRLLRVAVARTTKAVRIKLADASRSLQAQAQHAPAIIRDVSGKHPLHPAALLRQRKRGARWLSTAVSQNIDNAVRRFITADGRSARFSTSNTARRVAQSSGRAPFASALRPNLTGGALPRTAGGYGIGGSARYFSHTPAAPAQVAQNVSQAMRAFFLSGQKIKYDGMGSHGRPQYRAVSKVEDDASQRLAGVDRSAPGAFIDFNLKPTITALGPLAAAVSRTPSASVFGGEAPVIPTTLHTEGFLDVLGVDFDRALNDLKAVHADLERLSVIGDLTIVQKGDILRVRFPGVDASTVERLCDDVGVCRGIVGQDDGFGFSVQTPDLLKFPFAPDSYDEMPFSSDSLQSLRSHEMDSFSSRDSFPFVKYAKDAQPSSRLSATEDFEGISVQDASGEFEGLEGIYRFIAECDRGRERIG